MKSAPAALFLFFLLGSGIAQIDPNVGVPRFSNQIGGTYDSINPATSNILISLPIRDKTGKIPVSLKLASNFHLYDTNGSPDFWATTDGADMFSLVTAAGDLGAAVSFSAHSTPFACKPGMFFMQFDSFVVFDETGAYHQTNPATILYSDPSCGAQQGTVQTVDGSGYKLNLAVNVNAQGTPTLNYTLIDKSGNVQTQSTNSHTVTDSDGVQAQYSWARQGPSAVVSVITDSLGQTMMTETSTPFVPGGTSPGGIPTTYQYTDANGQVQTLTVNYSQYSVQANFGCTGIEEYSYTDFLPSSIAMADRETFRLSYEPTPGHPASVTGRIAKLTLPLGGSISYGYSGGNNGIYCALATGAPHMVPILTRTVDDGNGNVGTWTYVNSNSTGSNGNYTVTETDPQSNVTVYTFTAAFGNQTAGTYETQRKIYQGAASPQNLLKTIITCYNGNFSNCASPQLPPSIPVLSITGVTQTDVYTYLNGSPNGSLVETKFNMAVNAQGIPIDLSGTVAEVKEYDLGAAMPPTGAPIKDTIASYGSWNGSSCSSIVNIMDHPCVVTVLDASGNTAAQTRYTYNAGGHPTQISRLVNGSTYVTSSATYAANGTLTTSTDANGTVTQYTNGACNGLLPTQITIANITTTKTWDCNGGVVSSTTAANSQVTNYGYQDPHTTGAADPLWRLTSITHPDGGQITTFYNPLSTPPNITTNELIDSSGLTLTTQTNFDGLGRVVQKGLTSDPEGADVVDTTYDTLGRTTSSSNPHRSAAAATDGITRSQYDALGRVTQITKQDGSIVSTSYAANCTTTTDEAGHQRKACADGLGRLTEVDEPGAGLPGSQASGSLTIGGTLQTKPATPEAPGRGTVGISGNDQTITIDPCQQAHVGNCPQTIPDAGFVLITVNGFQVQASYGPGVSAEMIASTLNSGLNDSSSPVTSSLNGALISLVAKDVGSSTNYSLSAGATSNGNGSFPTSFFTALSGPALTNGADGSPAVADAGTVQMSVGGYSATANYGNGTGRDSTAMAIASDLAAKIQSQLPIANPPFTISAGGGTITINWSTAGAAGNVAVNTTSTTAQTSFFSTPSFASCAITSNPQTCTTMLSGGTDPVPPLNTPLVTLYAYNALGNLLRVDQKGSAPADSTQWRTRHFTYDLLSRLVTAQNPESGTINYNYDPNGNLLQKVSPAPNQTGSATQTVSYCYDALNRITGKAYSAQTCQNGQLPQGTAVAAYTYDQGTNGIGRLTSLTDQAGSGSYTYDVMGRTATERRTMAGITKNLSYTYNFDGSFKTITCPSSATVTYTLAGNGKNTAGRIGLVQDLSNSINYVNGFQGTSSFATYRPDGQIAGFVSGNSGGFAGIANGFTYNNRLQPVTMSANAPSQTVYSINYDFHLGDGVTGADNGNVWAIINNKDSTRSQSFTYDVLNRLTSAQNAGTDCTQVSLHGKTKFWGNSYGYDAWGNLLQKAVTKCSAEPLSVLASANNQLSGYGYDAAGNMTSDLTDGVTSTYDAENRILTATKNGVTTAYTYDNDGNRVKKATPAPPATPTSGTFYWYMTPGIVAESDLSGILKSEYVYFNGERVARKDFPGNSVAYYFSDHLKTTAVVTDAQGNIENESDFYPWGGELQFINNDSNHYKFTGKERDSESGLDYFGARYYSNGLGRFITPDWSATPEPVPYADVGDPQSLNLYSYVRNNPLARTDPDGHCNVDGEHHGRFWCLAHALGFVATIHEQAVFQRDTWKHLGITIYANGNQVDVNKLPDSEVLAVEQQLEQQREQQLVDNFLAAVFGPPTQLPLFPDGGTISSGHAWSKHQGEFPGMSQGQFEQKIEETVREAKGADVKQLSNGRTAYWNDKEQMVVIHDAKSIDGGTAFRPTNGKAYFNNLK